MVKCWWSHCDKDKPVRNANECNYLRAHDSFLQAAPTLTIGSLSRDPCCSSRCDIWFQSWFGISRPIEPTQSISDSRPGSSRMCWQSCLSSQIGSDSKWSLLYLKCRKRQWNEIEAIHVHQVSCVMSALLKALSHLPFWTWQWRDCRRIWEEQCRSQAK